MKRKVGLTAISLMLALTGCMGGGGKIDPRLTAEGKSFILKGTTGLTQVSQITGVESPNKTERYGVYGTDLGSMMSDGDRTYFVFGDTFGERPEEQIGAGGHDWRSNTMAYSTDSDPTDGITLDGMILDDFHTAKELLPSAKIDYEEMTTIPTHGLAANGNLYLYYMSVKHWGDPGRWDANFAGLAKSSDKGQNWTVLDNVKWPGDSNFIQVSPYKVTDEDGSTDVYFWCIPAGRFDGVQLMKVSEEKIESLADYRYYAGDDDEGKPIWSADLTKAKTIVDDAVGELSVVWNAYLQRWIMTYLGSTGVVIREGLSPWGPWGDAHDLITFEQYPGLYGPFMNDKFTADGGKTIYFTLSLWGPYNVFWFKATLQK
ncbi:DUF4185 domain-containing protein [Cohnella soli]|uniref:DUF4185 domain-containing protein n=1 Tax=Cohnella soli TaxID=425005 RepID=A0ABW0I1Z2_9BACL